MRANWQFFLLALLMAATLWFMVSGREEVEAWTKLRIEMKGMPANLLVTSGIEPTVDVRVRAPKGLLRALSDRKLAYSLDLSGLNPGVNIIPVHPEKVPLGSAYEVVEVRPSRLTLNVDTIETRQFPISVQIEGKLVPDIKVTSATVDPETVAVRGASALLNKVKRVDAVTGAPEATEPGVVELSGVVDVPDGLEATPAQVKVTFLLGLKTVQRDVVRTVELIAPKDKIVTVKRSKVTLNLELPESKSTDQALLDSIQAEIFIPDDLENGTHTLPFRVHLPEGVWLRSAHPTSLAVTIRKR